MNGHTHGLDEKQPSLSLLETQIKGLLQTSNQAISHLEEHIVQLDEHLRVSVDPLAKGYKDFHNGPRACESIATPPSNRIFSSEERTSSGRSKLGHFLPDPIQNQDYVLEDELQRTLDLDFSKQMTSSEFFVPAPTEHLFSPHASLFSDSDTRHVSQRVFSQTLQHEREKRQELEQIAISLQEQLSDTRSELAFARSDARNARDVMILRSRANQELLVEVQLRDRMLEELRAEAAQHAREAQALQLRCKQLELDVGLRDVEMLQMRAELSAALSDRRPPSSRPATTNCGSCRCRPEPSHRP